MTLSLYFLSEHLELHKLLEHLGLQAHSDLVPEVRTNLCKLRIWLYCS